MTSHVDTLFPPGAEGYSAVILAMIAAVIIGAFYVIVRTLVTHEPPRR